MTEHAHVLKETRYRVSTVHVHNQGRVCAACGLAILPALRVCADLRPFAFVKLLRANTASFLLKGHLKTIEEWTEFLDEHEFVEKKELGLADDPERPIYPKDDQLETKIENWVQVFTALLIEKCNENEGYVKDCDIVLASTKAYREKEDFYSQFFKENVAKGSSKDKIKKSNRSTF